MANMAIGAAVVTGPIDHPKEDTKCRWCMGAPALQPADLTPKQVLERVVLALIHPAAASPRVEETTLLVAAALTATRLAGRAVLPHSQVPLAVHQQTLAATHRAPVVLGPGRAVPLPNQAEVGSIRATVPPAQPRASQVLTHPPVALLVVQSLLAPPQVRHRAHRAPSVLEAPLHIHPVPPVLAAPALPNTQSCSVG